MALETVAAFFEQWQGKYCDFDGAYGPQCVDICQFFNRDVVGGPPLTGNAADVWETYPQAFYTRVDNTPDNVPELGDIVIWSGALNGGPGHIAVCQSGDANGFISFDQNWPEDSVCHFQAHDYSYVLGWLHPTGSVVPVPVQPLPAPRRTSVIAACGLKPQPAHGGPNVAEIPAGGQIIDHGDRQDGWGSAQWTRFYGWIEAANIAP